MVSDVRHDLERGCWHVACKPVLEHMDQGHLGMFNSYQLTRFEVDVPYSSRLFGDFAAHCIKGRNTVFEISSVKNAQSGYVPIPGVDYVIEGVRHYDRNGWLE